MLCSTVQRSSGRVLMLDSNASKRASRGDNRDLSADIATCLDQLIDQGYAELTVNQYRGSLRHFSHWVTRDKIKWRNHEEASVRRFLATHLPSCDCTGRYQHGGLSLSAALRHLLRCLQTHGPQQLALLMWTRSKRKYNDLMRISTGFVASRRRLVDCEGILFADSCPRALREVLSI
jgi:hypothetical protein